VSPVFGLSAREVEILGLLAQGLSKRGIAATLMLSRHTVNRHVANILRKMEARSRAAAAAFATRDNCSNDAGTSWDQQELPRHASRVTPA
jgi:DNA-binding NarL/FixJ family response regulator